MSYYEWRPYVPVAERRRQAMRKMERLRKKGLHIQPVEVMGRKIARTFWGQAWCDHLEKFSDFANRLPRGRTYVRNGSVCHLEIAEGEVKAMVSGSEIYNVSIAIKKLPRKKWYKVKDQCTGQIGSLLELLQGRLSNSVMGVVTDRNKGLFPLPREISLRCDCPDWAVMCKHVAAVLYGVGARLDERPELLFLLRGVDHEELISAEAGVAVVATAGKKGRRIADDDLSDVFGIEMSEEGAQDAEKPKKQKTARKLSAAATRRRRKKVPAAKRKSTRSSKAHETGKVKGKQSKRSTKIKSKTAKKSDGRRQKPASRKLDSKKIPGSASSIQPITGRTVATLRAKFKMSQSQFARLLAVSTPTVVNWEKKKGRLNLQTRTLNAWTAVAALTKKEAWKRLEGV